MPALANASLIASVLPADAIAERGAFHTTQQEELPCWPDGVRPRTIVLLGWTGGQQWPAFVASVEAADGGPNPIDRWSRRLIGHAASVLGALALYPFGGPPHHDFLGWALRAEPVARSPIGLLVHPRWGLWHAYRGALAFRERLPLSDLEARPNPCDTCRGRPCLSACPVGAFTPGRYDSVACVRHIRNPSGADCLVNGCGARRACPVLPASPYSPEQASFHMQAFLHGAAPS